MKDTIVQDVREARAALAERFGYDRARIIAWAREQTKARKAGTKATTESVEEAADRQAKPGAPSTERIAAKA